MITVRDVLGLAVFRAGAPIVLAGEAQLDRAVSWVHISDLPVAAPFLHGHELVLTHGIALRGNQALQKRYVRDLVELPAAGLVLELGRAFKEAPPTLVAEAAAAGLPLIALTRRIRVVDVTRDVHGAVLGEHHGRVTQAQDVGRQLMEMAMAGSDVQALLQALAVAVRNPVVLESAVHEPVAYARYATDPAALLTGWPAHSRSDHDGTRCVVEPITVRSRLHARLHVLALDSPLAPEVELVAGYGAWALAVAFLQLGDASDLATFAAGSFIADVVHRRHRSPQEAIARARTLGADLGGLVVAVVADLEGATEPLTAHVVRAVERAARQAGAGALARADGAMALMALGAATELELENALADVQAALRTVAGEHGARVRAGISETTRIAFLADAFQHARDSAALALGDEALAVARFSDLGVSRLLLGLVDGPDLAAFVEEELGRLLAHDASSSVALLPILRSYLAAGASKSEAARELFMGRRSLYNRLGTIEELLGRSLDDQDARTTLAVALRALELIRSRGPARLPT